MTMMQAWRLEATQGIESLQFVSIPRPTRGAAQSLVRVEAAALNFSDLLMLRGQYQVKPPLPFSPGQEIAGIVVATAAGSRLKVGERIASKVECGGFAQYVCVSDKMAIPVPDSLSADAAATLPVVWPTAWIALYERAVLQPRESVLVHAAAGGIGLACLQLARARGARPIALVGSRAKFDSCRAAGAEEVVCYDDPWVDIVREHGGADVVVDSVGGDATEASLRCMTRGARLLLVGFSSGMMPQIPANRLLLKNTSALGVYWSHDWDLAQVNRATAALLALYEQGSISLQASRSYAFDRLPEALRDLASRGTVGKSVLVADTEKMAND